MPKKPVSNPPTGPELPPATAIAQIRQRITSAQELVAREDLHDDDCYAWDNTTRDVLVRAFGSDSPNVNSVVYAVGGVTYVGMSDHQLTELQRDKKRRQIKLLESCIEQLQARVDSQPPPPTSEAAPADDTELWLEWLELLADQFHVVVRQLGQRHADRSTLEVNDEYDVQDLVHALLRIFFDDVRAEETTPSYAGGTARMDFLLKRERIVLEIKKTRSGLGAREIGEQLLIDIARYRSHPDCKTLVCFVYDPEDKISNPTGLERDLSGNRDGLDVRVYIRPR
jgi:hypothetical protein